MTKAEVLLWAELKNKRILDCKFRRQFSIGAYVLDFYCPSLRLAIEVDGATHVTDDEIEYDTNRQTEIENFGIEFLRFNNYDIYTNKVNVVESILDKINELRKRNPYPPTEVGGLPLHKGEMYNTSPFCEEGVVPRGGAKSN